MIVVSVQSQDEGDKPKVADWSGGYFSDFFLIEEPPTGFEDFESISVEYVGNQENDEELLKPNEDGLIKVQGKLLAKNNRTFKFKTSYLIEGGNQIKLKFVTKTIKGVNYSFEGEYLRNSKSIRKENKIVGYVHLEGTLTKYINEKIVAQKIIQLTPHWIM